MAGIVASAAGMISPSTEARETDTAVTSERSGESARPAAYKPAPASRPESGGAPARAGPRAVARRPEPAPERWHAGPSQPQSGGAPARAGPRAVARRPGSGAREPGTETALVRAAHAPACNSAAALISGWVHTSASRTTVAAAAAIS